MKTNLKTLVVLVLLLGSILACSKSEVSEPSTPEYDGAYLQDKYGELHEITSTSGIDCKYVPSLKYKVPVGDRPIEEGFRIKRIRNCYIKRQDELPNIILNIKSAKFIIYKGRHARFKQLETVGEYNYPKDTFTHLYKPKFGDTQFFLCGDKTIPTKSKTKGSNFTVTEITEDLAPGLYMIRYENELSSLENFLFRVQ